MLIKEAENSARQALKTIYDDREAYLITNMLLEDITSMPRIDRLSAPDRQLTTEQQKRFETQLSELLRHRPIQYVTHKSWFFGMELFVNEHVLIPRPETEELVNWVVSDVKASGKAVFGKEPYVADKTALLKVLDVGTGSGCIALALKKGMPKAEVWGCDVSEEALDVARRNSSVLNLRVDLQGVDFLDRSQQKQLPSVDIVVSNPPYIPLDEKGTMAANVVEFEPHGALFVPENDALMFYSALADFGKIRLHAGGCLYMETHENYNKAVVDLFARQGYSRIESRKDMQGKDRMIKVAI